MRANDQDLRTCLAKRQNKRASIESEKIDKRFLAELKSVMCNGRWFAAFYRFIAIAELS